MNLNDFKLTLNDVEPDPSLNQYLQALWQDAQGNWQQAHHIVQILDDDNAAWVHAYLHRKEGDLANAAYWYRRANKPQPTLSLTQEWEQLVEHF